MKIKYEFANETVEIEVSDDWGDILIDLDRQEYNIDHKETRRHCSLEAYNQDDALLPSDEDLEQEVMDEEDRRHLHRAIQQLDPRQQYLINEVYFKGRSVSEIARSEGRHESSVRETLGRAKKNLKKFL